MKVSFEAALREVWTADHLRATYGLEDGKVELMANDCDWRILMRSGRAFAWTRLWKVSDLSLQIHLIDRWLEELAERIKTTIKEEAA